MKSDRTHTNSRWRWLLGALVAGTLAECGPPGMNTDAGPAPMRGRMLTEAGSVASCPMGSMLRFTCSPTCGDGDRSCGNTPIIRICDAAASDADCEAGLSNAVLAEGSANCGGACSGVVVACPEQGVVKLAGYNAPAGGAFVCVARGRALSTM